MDKKVHEIIDRLNPTLRSIDEHNGQKRVREFYAMSPEDAYSIFEDIAEINGCVDKLKKYEVSEEEKRAEKIAEDIAEEKDFLRKERSANFTFDFWKIPIGGILVYQENPTVQCTVIDNRRVSYNNEALYMTPLAKKVSGKEYITNGPGWVARHFTYNGKLLVDIEEI